jgi:uncharacterized protein (DUF1800 family)
MSRRQGAIAANRFGMGARPGEIVEAASDPRGWLIQQIRPDATKIEAGGLLSAREVLRQRAESYMAAPGGMAGAQQGEATAEQQRVIRDVLQREARDGLAAEIEARSRHAAATRASFAERWARFWSNHFTVAARNAQMIGLAGPFEREAIRPHVFGDFTTLLERATLHPSMLVYLDAHRSIGPSTRPAQRRDGGLNENLAREVLELHTMGVGSGYTQADIVEFAKVLTGWSIAAGQGGPLQRIAASAETTDGAAFRQQLHEPGARTILNKRYRDSGATQASDVLKDLAAHPATARHVATKLARHFIADEPSPSAVAALEARFTKTSGDLADLARTLIGLDAAWADAPAKFRTPEELLIALSRAASWQVAHGRNPRDVYQSLGQQPFQTPSPAGWPDEAAAWAGADALKKRLEWANLSAQRMPRDITAAGLLDTALGELAGPRTREAVARAESREQGLTLAIMSPEFQRG